MPLFYRTGELLNTINNTAPFEKSEGDFQIGRVGVFKDMHAFF